MFKAWHSFSLDNTNRAHSGNRSIGNTYLTRDWRSTAGIDWKRMLFGERRLKTLVARSVLFDWRTMSIQPPLDGDGWWCGPMGSDDVASSKP